jgi:phosphoglycolate phosphatase
MNRYDYVIWDWNGTLIDDTWLCTEIMDKELKTIGKNGLTIAKYRREFKFPIKEFYETLGFDFRESPYETFAQKFIDQYEARRFECDLHFGISVLLKKMQTYGIEHSLLSAYSEKSLKEALVHYDIIKYFQQIKGLDNHYAGGKIDEGLSLIKTLDVDKSKVVLLGDTVHDKEVADIMGIDTILIKNGHQTEMKLNKMGCPVVSSISEAMLYIIV